MVVAKNLPVMGPPQYGVSDISKTPIWNLIQREINRPDLKFQKSKITGSENKRLTRRASEHT